MDYLPPCGKVSNASWRLSNLSKRPETKKIVFIPISSKGISLPSHLFTVSESAHNWRLTKKFILHHSSEIMIRLHYHFFITPKGKKCSVRNKVSCWNIYDQITHLSPHTCFRKVLIKRISWKLASLFDRRLTNAKWFLIKIRFEQMLEPLSDEQVWLWGIAKEPKCSQHRWNLKRCRLFLFSLFLSWLAGLS